MLQGLETLSIRINIHCDNAKKLAYFLQNRNEVTKVNYPGVKGQKHFEKIQKLFNGRAGGLLTFGLGTKDKAFSFIDSLKLAKNMANIGDSKTLVIHPASTIFHEFNEEEKKKMGITNDMIRVSVGIENFEDIKNDFEKAFEIFV